MLFTYTREWKQLIQEVVATIYAPEVCVQPKDHHQPYMHQWVALLTLSSWRFEPTLFGLALSRDDTTVTSAMEIENCLFTRELTCIFHTTNYSHTFAKSVLVESKLLLHTRAKLHIYYF
jgi:hypothetical protein